MPINSTLLLNMLAQQAPRLLAALQENSNVTAGFEEIPPIAGTRNIVEALDRGFDAPSIEEDVDSFGLGTADKLLGHALHGKNTTEGYFPSDYNPIGDAAVAARAMMNSNPEIGLPFDQAMDSVYNPDPELSTLALALRSKRKY